ncbi:hypothetical protein CS022_04935, partial [Veronia nyctiphanis]
MQDVLELEATDGTVQAITINITGTDTTAVIGGNSQSTLIEGQTSATGTVTLYDPDATTQPTIPSQTLDGTYGKLTMKSDGTWTYEVFPDKILPLDGGQQETDTFAFTASDGSVHKIVLTVTGTEDAPVVSGVFSGEMIESDINDAPSFVSGHIEITDADANDTPVFEDVTIEGNYGFLELVNGQWTYTLDRFKSGKLTAGEEVQETLTLEATDGTKQIITIDITGSNTKALISGDTQSTLGEGQTSAQGNVTLYDPDANTNPTMFDQTFDGSFGKLIMKSDGSWTYEVFPDKILPLDGGQTGTDTFTLTASDGSEHEIVMTVTGTEDSPVVSGIFSGALIESDIDDIAASVSGHIVITDVDTNDTPSFEDDTVVGQYGTLVLVNGQWTYTLDRDKSGKLKDGEAVREELELEATDGTKQIITIDITGSNTKAVISGDTQSTLGEGQTSAMGIVTLHDPDADSNPTMPDETVNGTFGKLTMNSNGTWTYEVFPDKILPLDGAQEETDTFVFTASDGSQHEIIMTVTGTEDDPVVTGVFSGAVTESDIGDIPASVSGHIAISDVDTNDTPSFEDNTVEGKYGTLVLANGQWTYTLDRDKSGKLKDGQEVKEEIELEATDGTKQIITIDIKGSDTAAVISGDTQSTLGEGQTSAEGTVTLYDPDADSNPTMPDETVNGTFGKLTMNSDGTWTYEVFPDKIRPLDGGQKETDTFVFVASDGSKHEIVMTVTGTEDDPVVSGVFSGAVTESDITELPASVSGHISITDDDSNDTPSFNDDTIEGQYGTLELVNGQWTYTLDREKSGQLKDQEQVKEELELQATDGTVQVITINITGSDTDAVISGNTQATLVQGQTSASGTVTLYDPDADTQPTMPDQTLDGSFGKLTMNSDGTWSYEVFPDKIIPLDEKEEANDTFTFTASDGSVHEIVMTVTGSEDASVVSGIFNGEVTEPDTWSTPVQANGTLSIMDPDTKDTPAFNDITLKGKYGEFALANGQWTYTLDEDSAPDIAHGATERDSFTLTATDGTTKAIDIVVKGTPTEVSQITRFQDGNENAGSDDSQWPGWTLAVNNRSASNTEVQIKLGQTDDTTKLADDFTGVMKLYSVSTGDFIETVSFDTSTGLVNITLPANQGQIRVLVQPKDDALFEGNKNLTLNAKIESTNNDWVTSDAVNLSDNEVAPFVKTLTSETTSFTEGDDVELSWTLALNNASASHTTLRLDINNLGN